VHDRAAAAQARQRRHRQLRVPRRAGGREGRAGPAIAVPRRLATLLLVGATLAAFCRVFDNPWIQSVRPIWRHFVDPRTMSTLDRVTEYRPLVPLTLSLNFWLSGSRVASYHAVNLLAHLAAVLFVYAFLLELTAFGRADG